MSLGAFLRCAQYGPTERLAYTCMVSSFDGGRALLYVHLDTVKTCCALDVRQLVLDMTVDLVLALVAIGRLTEFERDTLEDQEWFQCNYNERKIRVLPAEPPMVRRSASGVELREGGQSEVKLRY